MCQKKIRSYNHRHDSGLESMTKNRPQATRSPANDTWNDTLRTFVQDRGYFLSRWLCTTGHARHAPSIQFRSTSFKPSVSFSRYDTVLFGQRLTVRFVSFAALTASWNVLSIPYTARFNKLIRHFNL